MANGIPFEALVALAVQTHLDWEAAEAAAEAAQHSRAQAWSAVAQTGAGQGGDATQRLWHAVHDAKLARSAPDGPYAAFLALVRIAAAASLDLLAAMRLSHAFAAAKAARPAGMSEGRLQGLYEAAREQILTERAAGAA